MSKWYILKLTNTIFSDRLESLKYSTQHRVSQVRPDAMVQYFSDSKPVRKNSIRQLQYILLVIAIKILIREKCNLIITMYVARHKNKFIKNAQTPQGRRPPVIDFQNEIIEMYVRREGEEEGREKGEGVASSDGLLTKG